MANDLNYQPAPKGFSSYLTGIIPQDQAVAAGAFGRAMLQIRNIENVDAIPFAKVVHSMENTNELTDVNGTNKPTDESLADAGLEKQALGGGVYGTYTTSNYFGAMSGLPYPWKNIYDNVKSLETLNLKSIYQNLYLAITWKQAAATYDGTTFTYSDKGGGYGRDGVSAPTVTVGGNTATAIIGTDPNDLSTYGKIVSITYTGAAGAVVIDAPPGSGWPAMNAVVQGYIDQANAEIASIKNQSNNNQVSILNTNWDITGIALKQEQRARYNTIEPVDIPYNNRFAPTPTAFNTFVDSIPNFASNTEPHMVAQTLENITDRNTVGGQSIVAMMRQERNQQRLAEVGIDLDNNIPDKLDIDLQKQLLLNGTLCGAVEGIQSPNGCVYTIPSNADCPKPYNYYDDGKLKTITSYTSGSIQPILDGNDNPIVNQNAPAGPGVSPPNPINPFVINQNVNTFPSPNINSDYTTSTLCPATYSTNEAIDKVTECNCDCWVK